MSLQENFSNLTLNAKWSLKDKDIKYLRALAHFINSARYVDNLFSKIIVVSLISDKKIVGREEYLYPNTCRYQIVVGSPHQTKTTQNLTHPNHKVQNYLACVYIYLGVYTHSNYMFFKIFLRFDFLLVTDL